MRADGTGIGKRQPNREAIGRSRVVKGIDHKRVVLLGDDDAGDIPVNRRDAGELPLDAVDGQAWQPQAEDPPLR
jgi:hypothetical protein